MGRDMDNQKVLPYFPMDLEMEERKPFALPSLSPTNIRPTAHLNALPSGTTLSMEIDKKDPLSNYFWNHPCPDLTLLTRGGDSNCTVSPINISWDIPVAVQDNQTNSSTSTNISGQNRLLSEPAVPEWVEPPCMQPVSTNTNSSISTAGINPIAEVEVNTHWPVPNFEQGVFNQTWMQLLTQAKLDLHCTMMAADDSNTKTDSDMEHSILTHAAAGSEKITRRVEHRHL